MTEHTNIHASVITLFPALYQPFFSTSLIARAHEQQRVSSEVINLFSFCAPKERVDSPSYGPGAGMLIKPEIVQKAIDAGQQKKGSAYKIFFSPHGKKLTQTYARMLAQRWLEKKHFMFVCARYEGMDARVEDVYADEIISIGDYVLMGGDIPAMALIETVLRYIPGIVGDQSSVEHDSFSGPLVDYPEYTDPLIWHDKQVPDIIRSGNHQKIADFRQEQALKRTIAHHFDWFRSHPKSHVFAQQARHIIPPHYVALMHTDVQLKDGRIGTSSITSIDVHDIARSATTFGLKKYFVVSSLEDQQQIITTLLEFWHTHGPEYNASRAQSLKMVQQSHSLDEVIQIITQETGKKPLLIGTSAREHAGIPQITYHDQELIWAAQQPVLFLFGTGYGLAPHLLARCDYILAPIHGLTDFNHLAVRSAAAIVFDRWLGFNKRRDY